MSKFYIVKDCYAPSTASTNRMLGFIKEFSKLSESIDVVFFMPDSNQSKAPVYPNVKYHYYWKYLPITNNFIRFFLYIYVYKFVFALTLKKGDTVLLLGASPLVNMITKKKGVNVFHERTEHPEVVKLKFTNLHEYYQATKKLDGLFAISKPIADFFISQGVDKEKVHVINMTVDPSRFANLEKESTDKYIAYCGTASNNKDGVDELIKAFALVHKSHPDVKLYIIGSTPSRKEEFGNLKLVEELGITESVVFTGRIAPEQMPQILKNAQVLALDRPKNQQADYGFPTKLGEYLLTGNPVVVTNVGAIPSFLEDGKTALIAEERNPDQFASKICWALENPDAAALIGVAGLKVALDNFNAEIESRKMYHIMFDCND